MVLPFESSSLARAFANQSPSHQLFIAQSTQTNGCRPSPEWSGRRLRLWCVGQTTVRGPPPLPFLTERTCCALGVSVVLHICFPTRSAHQSQHFDLRTRIATRDGTSLAMRSGEVGDDITWTETELALLRQSIRENGVEDWTTLGDWSEVTPPRYCLLLFFIRLHDARDFFLGDMVVKFTRCSERLVPWAEMTEVCTCMGIVSCFPAVISSTQVSTMITQMRGIIDDGVHAHATLACLSVLLPPGSHRGRRHNKQLVAFRLKTHPPEITIMYALRTNEVSSNSSTRARVVIGWSVVM